MSVASALHRQYIALLTRWPHDALRPEISFTDALSKRVNSYFNTHAEADSTLPTQNTDRSSSSKAGTAEGAGAGAKEGRPVMKFNEAAVKREVNTLAALLEDRFKTQYPVSEKTMKPKGKPEYYEKLMRELEEAPRRSWWQTQINSWKGYIRMS